MQTKTFTSLLFFTIILSCTNAQTAPVKHIGAMQDMGKMNFAPTIRVDTIADKEHLFGIGPLGRMQGEITIVDGKPLSASVNEKGDGIVQNRWDMEAPFFVYANVQAWRAFPFSIDIKNQADLQTAIADIAQHNGYDLKTPFPFRITGTFEQLTTHIVMPRNPEVPGYQENKNQANYDWRNETGELIGFYSESHQRIFTHHDSYIHVHFVNHDYTILGHVDKIQTATQLTLYLPDDKKMPDLAPVKVNDTDFSKGRLGNIQHIQLTDLERFHGHLCDGLVIGYLGLQEALYQLYPDSIIDRTNTRIVSKPSPCLTDAAIYLTGGRYQFNTFYVNKNIEGLFVVQRIDNGETRTVMLKPGVKPAEIARLTTLAEQQTLSACDLDRLRQLEDDFSDYLLRTPAAQNFIIQKVNNFRWGPVLQNNYIKTDILNKNKEQCY